MCSMIRSILMFCVLARLFQGHALCCGSVIIQGFTNEASGRTNIAAIYSVSVK
jgi:hypothetical protein